MDKTQAWIFSSKFFLKETNKKGGLWWKVSKQVEEPCFLQTGTMWLKRIIKEKIGHHLLKDNSGKKDKFDLLTIWLNEFINYLKGSEKNNK